MIKMSIKKALAAAATAAAILGTSVLPVFADQPANPGCVGKAVKVQGQAGTRDDVVHSILSGGSLGAAIQAWKGPACGLPAGH